MFKYFDSHSHLNFRQYEEDREEIIDELRKKSIATITVGTDLKTSEEAVGLAGPNEHLFATIGLHPTDVDKGFDPTDYDVLVGNPKVVGVGECGLDYFRLGVDEDEVKQKQNEVFRQQIDFALKHDLALMLHIRPRKGTIDAYSDALDVLREYHKKHGDRLRGTSHFFSGGESTAREFLDLGFTVSFAGPITFASEYESIVRYVPLDMILAETDSPFATPALHRGKRNEPTYVVEVVEAVARIKGAELSQVEKTLVRNIQRVFPARG